MDNMNSVKLQSFVFIIFILQDFGNSLPAIPTTNTSSQSLHRSSTGIPTSGQQDVQKATCHTQTEDIQICDRVRDGVNIAASLLEGLPRLQGPQGEPGPVGPRGNKKLNKLKLGNEKVFHKVISFNIWNLMVWLS